ncbi:MAG: hypothetical protein JSS66_09455 [Armatimonadetes bacterium]|nr:hypothetical protein [Armatimonadota bacterium]
MLATFAFLGTLVASSLYKVAFMHNFAKDTSVTYVLNIKGSGDQGDLTADAELTVAYGEKSEKGVNAKVKPKSVVFSMNGQAMDMGTPAETPAVLDPNGMPDSLNMNNADALVGLTFILSYLPNAELDENQTFDVKWKLDTTTLTGIGRFDGFEDLNGKKLPKLHFKVELSPNGENPGQLEYDSLFDPVSGHVEKTSGSIVIESMNLKFTQTRKS